MIYLLLAIASSTMVSVFMRMGEKYIKNNMSMFTANYAVCIVLSRIFMGKINLFTTQSGIGRAVLLGVVCGVLYLMNFVLLQQCIRRNGVTLAAAFMKLGVLVPTLMAIVVFRERPGILQVIGIVLALTAIVVIHFEKDERSKAGSKLWLLILLVLSGVSDSIANIYDKTGVPELSDHYLFYTFAAAFMLALILGLKKKEKTGFGDLFFGVLIGIPNYFSARFLLLALGRVPAVVAYPACNVGTIVMISILGAILFREHISKKKAAALGLVIVALILLNM